MKTFALVIILILAIALPACADQEQPVSEPLTVTALINESIMPVARGEKYGRPLDGYLSDLKIGEIVGAGTALSPTGGPAWVEIVIELTARESSVEGIARKLRELGAPEGSYLYYYVGNERRQVVIR